MFVVLPAVLSVSAVFRLPSCLFRRLTVWASCLLFSMSLTSIASIIRSISIVISFVSIICIIIIIIIHVIVPLSVSPCWPPRCVEGSVFRFRGRAELYVYKHKCYALYILSDGQYQADTHR